MPRFVLVVVALGACGAPMASTTMTESPPRPAVVAAGATNATGHDVASPPLPPSSSLPAPSLLAALDHGDLALVTFAELDADDDGACRIGSERTWIVSALDARDEGATCIGNETEPPACVVYAGTSIEHVTRVLCPLTPAS